MGRVLTVRVVQGRPADRVQVRYPQRFVETEKSDKHTSNYCASLTVAVHCETVASWSAMHDNQA